MVKSLAPETPSSTKIIVGIRVPPDPDGGWWDGRLSIMYDEDDLTFLDAEIELESP